MASPPAVALTIAGFDPSSGAGVTADLQVFAAHGLFGTAALTALTVQSTQGVAAVRPVDPELLRATLDELQADLPAAGIKIGMLGGLEAVRTVAAFLQALPHRVPVVLDPVLRSSSGHPLLAEEAATEFRGKLLPLVDVVTPNWAELAVLSQRSVNSEDDVREALNVLGRLYPGLEIVATGGDQVAPVDLLRLSSGQVHRLPGARVDTKSTHGTGCAFSSALLCRRTTGAPTLEAAVAAKRYVEGALRHAPGLGRGRGPMALLWPLLPPTETPVS